MTTTLAAQPHTVLADLVLVRMSLPSKKPVPPATIREDIGKLLPFGLPADEFDRLRSELASAGFLMQGKRNTYALTETGRDRALHFLGIAELPPGINWSAVIARYLFPRAAELSENAAAKLDDADKLAAFLIKRRHRLPSSAGTTIHRVLEAVVCKELGHPEETTLDGLLRAVICRLMGSERLTRDSLRKQFPLFDTGQTALKADAIRRKIVQDWLGHQASMSPRDENEPPEPFDLPAFAATVRALAANSPPEDRFHDNKVFIASLWRASQREPNFPRLSLAEFKERLIEANTRNLLHLSRADLVQAMEPQLVAESETEYLNATFHFVLLEGNHR
jgi:hypothetical protein